MADIDQFIRDLLARYAPRGSAAMQQRGPWMRDHLHPQVADMLARFLQYGPAAIGSRGGAGAGDAAAAIHQMMRRYPNEPVVTGGEPNAARWGAIIDSGGMPNNFHNSSSGIGARPGVLDDLPGAFNQRVNPTAANDLRNQFRVIQGDRSGE